MRIAPWAGMAIAVLAVSPALATETITRQYESKGHLVKMVRSGTVNDGVTAIYAHDKTNNRTNVTIAGSANSTPP